MRHSGIRFAWLLLAAAMGCAARSRPGGETVGADDGVRLVRVARGFDSPTFLTSPPGDPRLFVLEQGGVIRIVRDGRPDPRPFLDLRTLVSSGGERGLLGLAFHPDYAKNRRFFVNYTDERGDTRVVGFTASEDPNRADPSSEHLVLTVRQPYSNHNGGMIAFGPDRMLWIGMGDGGAGGDPHGNGQNPEALLGKMLRIDVDHAQPYSVPSGNMYAQDAGRREIWAIGMRNPWRFSFDRANGTLYVGDVGQNQWEEIDVVPSDRPGLNFGWRLMEGRHCYRSDDCDPAGLVAPAVEYPHAEGCSVTGGYVYRGTHVPSLAGHYVYGDYCSGWIRSFRWDGQKAVEPRRWNFGSIGAITSFGEDAAGEVYVLVQGGEIYRFEASL